MRARALSTLTLPCALLLAGLLASGCGGARAGDTSEVQRIDISFEGGEVTPQQERVEVGAGQDVDLEVTADEPGEIHVHSDPEQQFPYEAGTSTFKLRIDRPGIVEVESHDLGTVIVELEVR